MDELIDALDTQGNPTGETILKSQAHHDGIFHATVHIWFYTKTGEVLIQQRGKLKKTFPLLWDISVAGHVGAGETIINSALREIKEEIGITVKASELQKIGVFKAIRKHSKILIDCEFHHTYLAELKVPLAHLKKQESEVSALNLIPISIFETFVASDKFVPNTSAYYHTIFKAIEAQL